MNLEQAKASGLAKKPRKRVGRGIGSGNGKTCGRGHKGAKARSGWSRRDGWEGGQMPLFRRLPKRGFNNKNFRKFFTIINVGQLNDFDEGAVVDLAAVVGGGLVSKEKHTDLFKILGDGELTKKITVKVDAISASARQKIEAAGGTVELIAQVEHRPKFIRKGGVDSRAARAARADAGNPAAGNPAAGNPAAGEGEQS